MIGSRGITEPQSKLSGAKDKTVALTEDVMQLNDGPVRRSSPGKNVDVKLYEVKLKGLTHPLVIEYIIYIYIARSVERGAFIIVLFPCGMVWIHS